LMGKDPNTECLKLFRRIVDQLDVALDVVGIEMFAGYGRSVGKSTFEACKWVGRFEQMFEGEIPTDMIYRKGDVCPWICRDHMAKDKDVRAALIKRYGPPGTKKAQGKLYGVKADIWSALAIAITCVEKYHDG